MRLKAVLTIQFVCLCAMRGGGDPIVVHSNQSPVTNPVQVIHTPFGAFGEIDWVRRTVRVRGRGAPPKDSKGEAAKESALAAAMMDGCANLAGVLYGVKRSISSIPIAKDGELTVDDTRISTSIGPNSLGEGLGVSSDVVVENYAVASSKVTVRLRNTNPANSQGQDVTLRMEDFMVTSQPDAARLLRRALDGRAGRPRLVREAYDAELGLATIFLETTVPYEKITEIAGKQKPPAPATPVKLGKPMRIPKNQKGPFTGLIVECRGTGLRPAMSPRVVDKNGADIWNVPFDDAPVEKRFEQGLVGYYATEEDARRSERAGKNPLILRALGAQGSFQANPVVSVKDGKRLLKENAVSQFLDKFNVVFLYDR